MSSMKALIRGSATLEDEIKFGTLHCWVYSIITFIPARNKTIETVHPAKIPLKCWCQLLGALSENDLLQILLRKKLSRFRDFWQNSRKFVPAKYLLSINRESLFSRKKMSFRLAKVKKPKNLYIP